MIFPPAVDSHAHIFDRRYPFTSDAHYLPSENQQGQPAEFRDVLRAHGFSDGLLIGPMPYGFDNSAMLDAIKQSKGHFKGIALVSPKISDRELAALSDGGVIGMRINPMFNGQRELTEPGAERLLARVKEMNWFVQVHCEKDNLVESGPLLRKAGVRVMVDHFGRPDPAAGVSQPGFQTLLEFGRSGNAVVKLSGPFRSSRQAFPYTDIEPFIEAAVDAFTLDNCVWGSDWPFVLADRRIDYGPPLSCLGRWLPDDNDRRKVLWDTPSRLFGFRSEEKHSAKVCNA
jgi:predicted TIM-barrel fold metal-dependent hydrolase